MPHPHPLREVWAMLLYKSSSRAVLLPRVSEKDPPTSSNVVERLELYMTVMCECVGGALKKERPEERAACEVSGGTGRSFAWSHEQSLWKCSGCMSKRRCGNALWYGYLCDISCSYAYAAAESVNESCEVLSSGPERVKHHSMLCTLNNSCLMMRDARKRC